MAEKSRLQVREDADEQPWADVGHASKHQKLPVTIVDFGEYASGNSLGISCADKSLQSHFEAITGWVENTGADGLAVSTDHRGVGTKSLEFDKIAGNVAAMISKTIASFDMNAYSTHAIGHMHVYISDLTEVDYVFVRMGTDSSNYWQWNFDGGLFSDGWNDMNTPITSPTSQTGAGLDLSGATWMAFGVVFDGVANTLADIRTSGWIIKRVLETSQIVSADIQLNSPHLVIKDRNSNNRLDVAKGAAYNYLYNRITDGANLMPAGDISARSVYVNLGTNNDVSLAVLPDTAAGDLAALVAGQLGDGHGVTVSNPTADPETGLATSALQRPDAQIGPGDPNIDSYTHASINLATGANQLLISSAANKQIWVYGIAFTCSVAGTVSFQDEDDTAITGIMDFYANSGLNNPPSGNFAMPIWKLATDKDLEVDIVDCDVDGWIDYAIVSV